MLVGHDWGAVFAARAATAAPERWRSLATMAVPPERTLLHHPPDAAQAARSWYMLLAQLPGAERAFARDDFALVEQLWRTWSPGYEPDTDDLRRIKATLDDPGGLRAALSYYRGMAIEMAGVVAGRRRLPAPPGQPHLVLHGEDDGCIGVELARAATAVLAHPASRVEVLPAVGHFLQLEAPGRVGELVLDHLDVAHH